MDQKAEALLKKAKSLGFSDRQIAFLTGKTEDQIRDIRKKAKLIPSYRLVDTCAAEFEAYTPYFYSTYDTGDDEIRKTDKRKVMILGGGPNRIGQGIEFDYCCVHAAFALREDKIETIMVNSNPETVSTDYDTSDKLYFEPLTLEDVLHIYEREKCWGAIAQFGGQTPLNLALGLKKNGVNVIGTSPESIEIAEDRKLFAAMLDKLQIPQPPNGLATNEEEALKIAQRLTYPILVRPSFVLGGRAMQIVFSDEELRHYMRFAVEASPERPVLVDKYLEDATEVDVDCIADVGLLNGKHAVIGGMLEHIEFAGVHSGDAAMVLPPHTLSPAVMDTIRKYTTALAHELKVVGLMNIQYAVKDEKVYVLEVNPRASRTIPFVSKAIGVPLAKLAARVMVGKTLKELGFTEEVQPKYWCVKESVFPFNRFQGVDILLGPEMRSTGEVMGLDHNMGIAYAKSQMATQTPLPTQGNVFISVRDSDKIKIVPTAKLLSSMGFELYATKGTAEVLEKHGVKPNHLLKISEGRPNVLDMLKNGKIDFIINTPGSNLQQRDDERLIRREVLHRNLPIMTTTSGGWAAANGIQALKQTGVSVKSLQEYHAPYKHTKKSAKSSSQPSSGGSKVVMAVWSVLWILAGIGMFVAMQRSNDVFEAYFQEGSASIKSASELLPSDVETFVHVSNPREAWQNLSKSNIYPALKSFASFRSLLDLWGNQGGELSPLGKGLLQAFGKSVISAYSKSNQALYILTPIGNREKCIDKLKEMLHSPYGDQTRWIPQQINSVWCLDARDSSILPMGWKLQASVIHGVGVIAISQKENPISKIVELANAAGTGLSADPNFGRFLTQNLDQAFSIFGFTKIPGDEVSKNLGLEWDLSLNSSKSMTANIRIPSPGAASTAVSSQNIEELDRHFKSLAALKHPDHFFSTIATWDDVKWISASIMPFVSPEWAQSIQAFDFKLMLGDYKTFWDPIFSKLGREVFIGLGSTNEISEKYRLPFPQIAVAFPYEDTAGFVKALESTVLKSNQESQANLLIRKSVFPNGEFYEVRMGDSEWKARYGLKELPSFVFANNLVIVVSNTKLAQKIIENLSQAREVAAIEGIDMQINLRCFPELMKIALAIGSSLQPGDGKAFLAPATMQNLNEISTVMEQFGDSHFVISHTPDSIRLRATINP